MFHHLFEEVRLHRVDHVEIILSRRPLALREFIRKILGHVGVARELRPERPYREFIIVGNLDVDHILLPEQLLLIAEHLFEEVFVYAVGRRQVELYCNGVRE